MPPKLLDGKYHLLRELGRGGAGRVYEAEHLIVGKRVAIKLLDPELSEDPELSTRFVSEARAAARIAHANVVDIYDLGITKAGQSYLVMELVEGETLEEVVETRGALAPGYACELMLQVLAALAAAHDRGVLHRDLKPANVMVTHPRPDRPHVKVLDFGISELVGHELPIDGSVNGTPMYIAPERALGRPSDERADVYSAGAMLYEMLAGRPPFRGSTVTEVISNVVSGEWLPLGDGGVPAELVRVVERAMAFEPGRRPASARALARELAQFTSAAPRSLDSVRSQYPFPLLSHATESAELPSLPAGFCQLPVGWGVAAADSPPAPSLAPAEVSLLPSVGPVFRIQVGYDRTLTDSLLCSPRIPKAPTPPRIRLSKPPATPISGSERAQRQAPTHTPEPPRPRAGAGNRAALFFTAAGFGIGAALAWLGSLI